MRCSSRGSCNSQRTSSPPAYRRESHMTRHVNYRLTFGSDAKTSYARLHDFQDKDTKEGTLLYRNNNLEELPGTWNRMKKAKGFEWRNDILVQFPANKGAKSIQTFSMQAVEEPDVERAELRAKCMDDWEQLQKLQKGQGQGPASASEQGAPDPKRRMLEPLANDLPAAFPPTFVEMFKPNSGLNLQMTPLPLVLA